MRTRFVHRIVLILGFAFALTATVARADVPTSLCVQGYLDDVNTGQPIDAPVDFCVAIFDADAGGTQVWPSVGCCAITADVENGLFALTLGEIGCEPLTSQVFASERWAEVSTNGEVMSPRIQLRSAPYALRVPDALELGAEGSSGQLTITNGQSPNQETILLGGASNPGAGDFGGIIGVTEANGVTAIQINGQTNDVSVFTGQVPAQETITLSGDGDGGGANGGALFLRDTSGTVQALLSAGENEGVLYLNRSDGANNVLVQAAGEGPTSGGSILLRNGPSTDNFAAYASDPLTGDGGAWVSLSNGQSPNQETITLDAHTGTGLGGNIAVRYETGDIAAEIDAQPNNGGIAVYSTSGVPTIEMRPYEPTLGGSRLLLRTTGHADTIVLNGETGSISAQSCNIPSGCDLAEAFDLTNPDAIQPGMVLVMDAANPGSLTLSTQAYDKKVAGIVSGAGGLKPGVVLGGDKLSTVRPPQAPPYQGGDIALTPTLSQGERDLPIALSGRVYCYVDATECAIEVGDLLTTSNTPGHATKVTDFARSQGAVLGKAMAPLPLGQKGLILVLVGLQ